MKWMNVLLLSAMLAGCGGGEAGAGGAGRWERAARWHVDTVPALVIGTGEGEDALHRVTAAARLADGRIAVVNAGSYQLKLFAPDGRHLASLGRRGGGPGEFRFPAWVGVRGDSLAVWDAAQRRLTIFDAAGRLARSASPGLDGGLFPTIAGQLGDGSLVVVSGVDPTSPDARGGGAWRGRTPLVRVGPSGVVRDTIAVVPGTERYGHVTPDGRGTVVEDLPFGRRTVVAVSGDRVYLGTGEDYRIRTVDSAGRARDLIREPWKPRRVTDADRREYWTRMVTLGSRESERAGAAKREVPYPETLPPYDDLIVDARGAVWVKEAQPPTRWDDPDEWRIYSAAGELEAVAVLPPRLRVQAIGDDWILAVALDAEQRETVRLYRLRRG